MMRWRALALLLVVAGIGALGTLATGAAMGMHASELAHLAALMVPALVVTLVAIAVARPLLARSSMRQSLVAVAIVGAVVGLANLVVLARQMFVNDHDATTLGVLFLYSTGAGVGAASPAPDRARWPGSRRRHGLWEKETLTPGSGGWTAGRSSTHSRTPSMTWRRNCRRP